MARIPGAEIERLKQRSSGSYSGKVPLARVVL